MRFRGPQALNDSLLGSSWCRLRYAITYPKISFPVGVFLRHGGVRIRLFNRYFFYFEIPAAWIIVPKQTESLPSN
jgi:hypothetical protein